MENIIQNVSAGLIALGLEALGINSYIVTNRDTFSSYEVATVLSYPLAFYAIYNRFSQTHWGFPAPRLPSRFLMPSAVMLSRPFRRRRLRQIWKILVLRYTPAYLVHV